MAGDVDLTESWIKAEDGVVDVVRLVQHLPFPWVALEAGPRRWTPTDVSVDVDDDRIALVRAVYRTADDRVVVVAAADRSADVDVVAEQLATVVAVSCVDVSPAAGRVPRPRLGGSSRSRSASPTSGARTVLLEVLE